MVLSDPARFTGPERFHNSGGIDPGTEGRLGKPKDTKWTAVDLGDLSVTGQGDINGVGNLSGQTVVREG